MHFKSNVIMYGVPIIMYDIIISVSGYEEGCEMRIFIRCTWSRLYQPHQSNKGNYLKAYLYFNSCVFVTLKMGFEIINIVTHSKT